MIRVVIKTHVCQPQFCQKKFVLFVLKQNDRRCFKTVRTDGYVASFAAVYV